MPEKEAITHGVKNPITMRFGRKAILLHFLLILANRFVIRHHPSVRCTKGAHALREKKKR